MASSPRYISEIHVPIRKDSLSFEDRHMKQWEDMESRMQERRKLWEDEFDRMRQEFFTLKPSETSPQARTSLNLDSGMRSMFEEDANGCQRFKVRFEVSEFKPDEIQVKVQDNKLIVNAKHEEKSAQTSVSREYSRQVDIPACVDQEKMECVLSKDGILSVESPVSQPQLIMGPSTIFPIKAPQHHDKKLDVATAVKNPIVTEADGSRKLRLEVDIGEFRPEDVVVKTMDRKLIVHAEHEEKTAGRTLHKEFNKEYDLPDSVDPSSIQAFIADDRRVTIEAPLKPVQRKTYSVTQSQDVRKVTMTKESSVTITDPQNRPVVTISVHRK